MQLDAETTETRPDLYGSLGREYAEPLAAPGTTGAAGAGVGGMAGMGATDLWDLEPGDW